MDILYRVPYRFMVDGQRYAMCDFCRWKNFEVIDEVNQESIPKWAFTKNLLGYIAGGGRIVFGFKNKDLKVTELPAYHTVTLHQKTMLEWVFHGLLMIH